MGNRERAAALRPVFLEQALESISPRVREWVPESAIREALGKELDGVIASVDDLERAKEFHSFAPRGDARPEDYVRRFVDFGDGRQALLSLRLKGGADGPPFIRIEARDHAFEEPEDLLPAMDAARRWYGVFDPVWLWVEVGEHETWLPDGALGAFGDQALLAAPIAELQGRERPQNFDLVRLESCTDTSFYDEYAAAYVRLHEASPFHRDQVSRQPQDEYEETIPLGHVYRAFVDGEWAGVMAAGRGSDGGMTGYFVQEQFLFEPFRGRRLAPAMQRHLIERLDPADGAVFFGTIDPGNGPSLASALRNGRHRVATRYFVPL